MQGDIVTNNQSEIDNQYRRIKMFNILNQVYPNIEYIKIDLIGVNYLEDFGIKPMNSKLYIRKEARLTNWVSEVNG